MTQPQQSATGQSESRELFRLMSAWADGVVTEEEFSQLDDLLQGDPTARQEFARYVRICQSLPDLVVPTFDDASSQTSTSLTEVSSRHRFLQSPTVRFMAITAACLLAVLGGIWSFLPPRAMEQPVAGIIEPAVPTAEVNSHLAVVTRSEDVIWAPNSPVCEIGAALGPSVLKLVSGTLEVEFACGASLRLRGPAEFSLLSASRGRLQYGELAAQVPDGAQGFTIDTPSVEVVDLGTEFGIKVALDGIADVHVFRGLVETRMTGGDEQPGTLERLSTNETRRFELDQPKSRESEFDRSMFPVPPERYPHEPVTQGAVCLLREPPKSLTVGTLESNEFILLFEERKDIHLPRGVPVSFSVPGRYDRFRGKGGKLRPPLNVDSYLMHFDALTTPRSYSHLRLDGSVTFPRPILGVIAVGPLLSLTDPLFGSPDIAQSEERSRGLDRNAKGDNFDVVTLSEDRRTLHVSFSVGGSCDQLRILIEAEAKPEN